MSGGGRDDDRAPGTVGTGAPGPATASPSRVRLRILDKEVQLACPPDEEEKLRQAAAYVDRAMRETRQRNTTSSLEKIAIVTAINTASSLLDARSRAGDGGEGAASRVARLNARLDELLTASDGGLTGGLTGGSAGGSAPSRNAPPGDIGITLADIAPDPPEDAAG